MSFPFLQRFLRDISISKKLYFTIGLMAFLIITELGTLWFALSTLSSVRSYVNGEGLWSKSQKNAVFELRIYAYSRNEKDYEEFRSLLTVPLGDRQARLELGKEHPDMEVARQGFIQGRNHPDDIDGMISLFRRFGNIYYIKRAITVWTMADSVMMQLEPLGEKLHEGILSGQASQAEINAVLKEIETMNSTLTVLEDEFSFTLGEGSRWLENIILTMLITLTCTVEATSILIAITVSKGIEKGLKEIISGAGEIARGQFSTRVKVYSKDEIGILATSFNQMTDELEHNINTLKITQENLKREKERAEASEKVKQLFLANMSHEIRTPMNAILGFARLLEDSSLNKEQKEFIRAIVQSGDDLMVILNDILDLSKIEAGKVTFERIPLHLGDIILSNINMMQPRARSKNLFIRHQIDPQIPHVLMGDPVRLNQIILNLVSNAVKFTERGGVNITVFFVEEDAERVVVEFSVRDTGIGIPEDKHQSIFESFEQATRGTTRKYGGTGLGLSIAKQLVEQQNGVIYVKSNSSGSDFRFVLPFYKIDAKTQAASAGKKQLQDENKTRETKVRVLVVEDNPVNQLLVTRVLQNYGFEMDMANNGKVALDKLAGHEYDIILMDLQMPEMDGYQATSIIRSLDNPVKSKVPIIAMTAHSIKGEYEKCMHLGMNEYVSKPFETKELLRKIADCIG